MRVGVKYCGGCREEYNRAAGFEKARGRLAGGAVVFEPAERGCAYDALLVVCGCRARCADISEYHANDIVFVDSKEGMDNLCMSSIKKK